MIIKDFSASSSSGFVTISATVQWEDLERRERDLLVRIPEEDGDRVIPRTDGLLAAMFVPARNVGERRIWVDRACGTLRDRLRSVSRILRSWYPEMGDPPDVEVGKEISLQPFEGSACCFLSCGIDSLCTLWRHAPGRRQASTRTIAAAFTVHFDRRSFPDPGRESQAFERARILCNDIGVRSIPVVTNARRLEPDGIVFTYKWHGAALTSIAHHFGTQFSLAYLASSFEYEALIPWGSHPLLDPNYGSARLQIEHDGAFLTRFEKIAMIAEWPEALSHVLVCQTSESNNCGRCAKCIRTQTALVALGRLQDSTSFADDDISEEVLATVADYEMISRYTQLRYYSEMVPSLAGLGRHDLVRAIDHIKKDFQERGHGIDAARAADAVAQHNTPFVVADDHAYGIPVSGTKGRFWGQPSSDDHAARQIAALKKAGYRYVLIRRDSWWLDYFAPLQSLLVEVDLENANDYGFRVFIL